MRHPKTFNELRALAVLDESNLRPRRTKSAVPNSWWDLEPTRERSWKRHRKTQFK